MTRSYNLSDCEDQSGKDGEREHAYFLSYFFVCRVPQDKTSKTNSSHYSLLDGWIPIPLSTFLLRQNELLNH